MKYLLDTNTCIALLKASPRTVMDRFVRVPARDVALCSIVKAELLFGAQNSQQSARNLARLAEFVAPFVSLKFDDDTAGRAASLRLALERNGTPMGAMDLLIAAIALHRGLTVVSHDADFGRVPSLRVEDWHS